MLEFRKMMGNKPDWELSNDGINTKIELAFKGLFHIYCEIDGLTDNDKMQTEAIVTEYSHRKMLMETLPSK